MQDSGPFARAGVARGEAAPEKAGSPCVPDCVANLLFLLAARSGDLAAAVITALYPAGAILLARGVPAERNGPRSCPPS
ncbi:hypothetical protein GCM10010517_44840 [Streptosporangium fragile]|uniref:Uncharacterized protein n=1 Tax=Streptosporangium fragile TaxID=46186 RepID=A0ABP6IGT4_9ACTN